MFSKNQHEKRLLDINLKYQHNIKKSGHSISTKTATTISKHYILNYEINIKAMRYRTIKPYLILTNKGTTISESVIQRTKKASDTPEASPKSAAQEIPCSGCYKGEPVGETLIATVGETVTGEAC